MFSVQHLPLPPMKRKLLSVDYVTNFFFLYRTPTCLVYLSSDSACLGILFGGFIVSSIEEKSC